MRGIRSIVSAVVAFVVVGVGCGGALSAAPGAASTSITNNQEAGVDEGGIVKAWGEYLVVLRRGRLFTVHLGRDDLAPVCVINAFPPGSEPSSWYDELLVADNRVVVIGYSYDESATEVGLFDLDSSGCIAHRGSFYLRSNDYYSTRNYASRLVGGKLVFYFPHQVDDVGERVAIEHPPAVRRYGGSAWRSLVTAASIHIPSHRRGSSTLHTVVSCDLANASLACRSQAILGGRGRTFYVSPRSVYVWVDDGEQRSDGLPRAAVYRLPLAGDSAPAAVRVAGAPTDQFSFKEDADGTLRVLVRSSGAGDWMAGPEHGSGDVALLRIPSDAFATDGIASLARVSYTLLARPSDDRALQNRFVGDYVLYGTGTSWGWASKAGGHLYAARVTGGDGDGEPAKITLPHGVDRIEPLGTDAIVIGSDGDNLVFSSIALGDAPALVHRFVAEGASQGELRSHGFFFLPDGFRHGILGLPVRGSGGPGYMHLVEGSAGILYLSVDALRLEPLGALGAHRDDFDDDCQASCTDWYGNARPIFYRGRVFALLGYELVEGEIREGRMVEVDRTNLLRDLVRGHER